MTTLTKRILRTLVALCLVVVLCVGTLQVSAALQTTVTYLALGDSITAGYGLTDPDTEGFVAKFADAISDTDTSVVTVNAGASGLTASNLVTLLASGSYDTQLAAADVITLTIGGNDLMAAFYETVATLYTTNENSGITYTSADVQTWLSDVSTYSTQVSTIISIISTDSGQTLLTAEVSAAAQTCVGNIETIVGLIRAANTDAVILLANQYNPYTALSSIPTYSSVSTLFATATSGFNTLLAANTTIASNCTIVDLYSAGVSTNVNLLTMNLDFHPNAAGHTTIANAMATAYAAATAVPSTDYVIVGTAELHDGYYTTDGATIATTVPTDNYAYYSSGVLYLKNFTYAPTSGTYGVYSENDSLTIDLCGGTSTLSGVTSGIYAVGDLTVTNGSLTVSAEYGICARGCITISDCTLSISTTGGEGIGAWYNFSDSNSDLTIVDSTVNVTVTADYSYGIFANENISISGSTVTATISGELVMGAIGSMGGNISITDESTVTAEVTAEIYSAGAITAPNSLGSITISESTVKASSVCTSTNTSYIDTTNYGAIYTEGDISITESEVTASTNGGGLYYGIDYFGAAICSGEGSILISGSDINATVDSSANYWVQYNGDVATAIVTGYGNIVIEANSEVTIDVKGTYAAIGIAAWDNLTISESQVEAKSDAYTSEAIAANNSLVIEDCENITATATGETSAAGVYGTDIGITGSSVNIKATVGSSGVELYGILAVNTVTITASEVIADGGIYIDSSTGTVTITPATGGLLKITKTVDTTKDVSIIDEATVISTSGYTYVAITEHVHAYDYDKIAWTWTDYENVTATVTCTDEDCDHAVTVTATVTSATTPATCTVDGKTVYTATATFGTTEYTDTATVAISATGHSYEAVVTAPTCT
ncbi:MAG: GDSL-type esterase/lipase family protein, partial [Oscillospiraceae bacterium]|nr:GDSL-type esterase/lipase family protein [Oscillospiraceae bacterium]